MNLYIMRHGDAMMHARTDAERPLSDYGRQQAAMAVPKFQALLPTSVIASPYLRAQQTAQIVCDALGIPAIETVDGITPESDPYGVLQTLEMYQQETLLMVSHQPLVGALVGLLVDGDLASGYMLGTATVAFLQCDRVGPGQAQLQWLNHSR